MEAVKRSFPAFNLCWSPAEVKIKNPATIIRINAVPPPTPIAHGRIKLKNPICVFTGIQPAAVFIPVAPLGVVHST